VRWLRSRQTPASYSSAGAGTPGHLASELFKSMTKVSIDHIPYKGAAPALVDLMGGQVHMGFSDMTISAPHLKSGRLRALAISSSARSPLAPDLPTVAESGLPGFEALVWYGLLGPAGTPPAIVRQVNAEVVRVLKLPETQQRFAALGATASPGSAEEFGAQIRRDYDKWALVIRNAGIKME
jgi:tripartite-type tricarboxylate transporter receptor subunit TctC